MNSERLIVECTNCADIGWVCEEHPDKPWAGMMPDDYVACCGGAGMPCKICNSGDCVRDPKGFINIYDIDGFHPHIVAGKDKQ